MKKGWNEKTKKTTVIAILAVIGIGAVSGIFICLHRDTPQARKAEEASIEVEDTVTVPEDTATETEENVVVTMDTSTETSSNEKEQSIQADPVKTEDKKPEEKPEEVKKTEEEKQESQPKKMEIPADEDTQENQDDGNDGNPQQGEIKDGKIYIEGFGWVDYEGGGSTSIPADDMYENGNKVGIMD